MRGPFIVVACLMVLIGGTGVSGQTQSFAVPQVCCRAVGTIDKPDQRFTGTGVPDWIRAAFSTPDEIAAVRVSRQPDYDVAWRCVRGEVLA